LAEFVFNALGLPFVGKRSKRKEAKRSK